MTATKSRLGHGTRACRLRGCERPECKAADVRYTKRLRLDRERGVRRRVSSGPAAKHVAELYAAGWTQAQISRAAGLPHTTLVHLGEERTSAIRPETSSKILAVRVGPPPQDSRDVDATGTRRRIRALAAIGYPMTHLASRFGLSQSVMGRIARGDLHQVRATTADVIALEYRHLSAIPGIDNRTRILARKKGWHGPLAWDDIDDPNCLPDATVIELGFRERAALRREEIIHFAWHGDTSEQILARLNGEVSISTVRQIVQDWRTGEKRDRKAVAA